MQVLPPLCLTLLSWTLSDQGTFSMLELDKDVSLDYNDSHPKRLRASCY